MGLRVLESKNGRMAALYCSTTDVAFGPVFYDDGKMDAGEQALAFIRWLPRDARLYSSLELESKYSQWLVEYHKKSEESA